MFLDEKFNSITGGVGAILAYIGFGALLSIGLQSSNSLLTLSFIVFGLALILLHTMSTLYHSTNSPKLKSIFQKLDHISIYLLIAGTYTPYMLVPLRELGGVWMLSLVWGMAVVGILLDVFLPKRVEWLQVLIYLAMGWVCVLSYGDLQATLHHASLIWLTAGGIIYTAGVIFYVLDDLGKMKHAHGIWHLFVLGGSICHFISVAVYIR